MIVVVELFIIFSVSTFLLLNRNSKIMYNIMLASDEKVLKSSVDNIIRDIESTRKLLEKEGKSEIKIKETIQDRLYAKVHSDNKEKLKKHEGGMV